MKIIQIEEFFYLQKKFLKGAFFLDFLLKISDSIDLI